MADAEMAETKAFFEHGSSADLSAAILGADIDMDETAGAATPLLEHEDFDWVRALLEREEVHRAQNPSASGDEDTASMELSTGPPVVGQRSSGKRGRGSRSEDSAGTEDADWRSRELDDFDGTGATEDGKRRKIAWTNTEDLVILTCVRRLGTQWPKIAVHLTGRTPDAVRNRWHRLQRTHSLANTEEGNAALDQLLIVAGVLTPEEAAAKPSQAPGAPPPPPPPPPAPPPPPPPPAAPPPPPPPPRRAPPSTRRRRTRSACVAPTTAERCGSRRRTS